MIGTPSKTPNKKSPFSTPGARPNSPGKRKAKSGAGNLAVAICVLLCCMLGVGVLLMVTMLPSDGATGPAINSLLGPSKHPVLSFSEKIARWVPRLEAGLEKDVVWLEKGLRGGGGGSGGGVEEEVVVAPPWEREFWTPIDVVDVDSSPVVILCKLDFRAYSNAPHLTR
jgi:hypothetical protein